MSRAHEASADVRVDATGVTVRATDEQVLDVTFDGRRVWSFWPERDGTPVPGAPHTHHVPWPGGLVRYLHGRSRITVGAHATATPLFDQEVRFGEGDGEERVAIVNAEGDPLGIDKSGRLTLTFETRSAEHLEPLLDAVEEVLAALAQAGMRAFPGYGTLLGAVRDGKVIGHDNDADLCYVSRHRVPVDVVRESFQLQRRLAEMGYEVVRYSGAAFKVLVRESDGKVRGLDVFGGFLTDDGYLILMGEIRAPFREEWLFPLGTTTLNGRTLPAPAVPERLLEVTYGPSWRVPDPAFHFETPASTWRRLNGWFRGTRPGRSDWDRRYLMQRNMPPRRRPDPIAAQVLELNPPGTRVVDLGCGRGHNAYWLAEQGTEALGLDYSTLGWPVLEERARRHDLPVRFAAMNLAEPRHLMAWAAHLSHQPGPTAVLARHLIDAMPTEGRSSVWRFAEIMGRSGGKLHLQFVVATHPDDPWLEGNGLRPLDPAVIRAELEALGARVVREETIDSSQMKAPNPTLSEHRRACRMVITWQE